MYLRYFLIFRGNCVGKEGDQNQQLLQSLQQS